MWITSERLFTKMRSSFVFVLLARIAPLTLLSLVFGGFASASNIYNFAFTATGGTVPSFSFSYESGALGFFTTSLPLGFLDQPYPIIDGDIFSSLGILVTGSGYTWEVSEISSGADFTLSAAGLPPQSLGTYNYGAPIFGDGNLQADPPIAVGNTVLTIQGSQTPEPSTFVFSFLGLSGLFGCIHGRSRRPGIGSA